AAVHLFAEAGVGVLFPGGDLDDLLQEAELDDDPRFGLVGGAGVGLSYELQTLRLRGDLMLDLYRIKILDEDVFDSNIEIQESGKRFWLLVGLEF
ncbi:MAG: hypothetical protein HYZ27_07705, partial [Deltaproteobacteria bacterium]|nr:hypothetical protein [Deltaproteobacteria bacterium]